MTDTVLLFVYISTFVELFLDVGAVYFAYKLTRITGAFKGWLLIIAAVILITLQATSSVLGLVLFYPQSELITRINSAGIVEQNLFGLGISITLFLAMEELFRTFSKLRDKQASSG